MERPIKFRAWDGKSMVDVPVNHSGYRLNELLEGIADNYELMQYTGLRDKNGKEIYESDLVEHRSYLGELIATYEVRWGLFGFTLHDPNHPEVTSHYVSPEQLEVVGNVWEAAQNGGV